MERLAYYGIGIGALAMGAASAFDRRVASHRRRTDLLRSAATALRDHYRALEAFVDDPDAPAILSEFLLDFSDSIDGENVAIDISSATTPGGRAPPPLSPLYIEIVNSVDRLRDQRMDLLAFFDLAISAGMTAAFFRRDKTREIDQATIDKSGKNPGHDIAFASTLVKLDKGQTAKRIDRPNRMVAA
jgi:hypothetical protein